MLCVCPLNPPPPPPPGAPPKFLTPPRPVPGPPRPTCKVSALYLENCANALRQTETDRQRQTDNPLYRYRLKRTLTPMYYIVCVPLYTILVPLSNIEKACTYDFNFIILVNINSTGTLPVTPRFKRSPKFYIIIYIAQIRKTIILVFNRSKSVDSLIILRHYNYSIVGI